MAHGGGGEAAGALKVDQWIIKMTEIQGSPCLFDDTHCVFVCTMLPSRLSFSVAK